MRGIRIPGGAALSRKQVDEIEAIAKSAGAAGMLRLKRENGELDGPAGEVPRPRSRRERSGSPRASCACSSPRATASRSPALDRVRQEVAQRHAARSGERARASCGCTDFPMFEKDPATGALGGGASPVHGAASRTTSRLLDTAPEKARALAYDVVLNGTELGGGSIRISDPDVQRRMFNLLGIDDATAQRASAFCSRGFARARRRTAASRSASTASRCCSRARRRCAT